MSTYRCPGCQMPWNGIGRRHPECDAAFRARLDAQPSLWGDEPSEPNVRSTDRDTSKRAGESVDVNAREAEVVDALRHMVVASSAHEITEFLRGRGFLRDKNCVSRRLTSLVRKGIVGDQGTKPGPYGRDVTAYTLRPAQLRVAS